MPYAGRFKLSLLGVLVSLILFILGVTPKYIGWLIDFPALWAVGFIVLLSSLTLYYDVKEKFWAEVIKKKESPK